jgi:hypothetical protein
MYIESLKMVNTPLGHLIMGCNIPNLDPENDMQYILETEVMQHLAHKHDKIYISIEDAEHLKETLIGKNETMKKMWVDILDDIITHHRHK